MDTLFNTQISPNDINDFINDNFKLLKPFFLNVSGTHVYGFPSSDSDIDIRGSFLFDKDVLLGFWNNKSLVFESHDQKIQGMEIDIVCHEINKYVNMLINGENGYVIEQIFSPIILFETDEFKDFKESVKKYYITKRLYKHYNSFAFNNWEKFKQQDQKQVKTLLYTFRVLHSGINLFNTGEVILNLKDLNEQMYKLSYIDELIDQKRQEHSLIEDTNKIDFYEQEVSNLFEKLELAFNESSIAENVRNRYKLSSHVANIYSNNVLNQKFSSPVMKYIDDRVFINKAKEKLLLESSPFYKLEQELKIKLSPKKEVFIPDLDRYFLIKQEKPRGNFFEFIDIEHFMQQIKKSNPFCLLALFNPDKEVFNPILNELIENKEQLITKLVYKTFKGVANKLFDGLFSEDNETYEPKQVILMLSTLVFGTNALKTCDFNVDLTPYFSMFTAIKNKTLAKQDIIKAYNDLLEGLEVANCNTILNQKEPDLGTLAVVLEKIKTKYWLSEE